MGFILGFHGVIRSLYGHKTFHDNKDFVLNPVSSSLSYKFLVLAPLMDPTAWKGFRSVLIIPRLLRNCVSRGFTGSVGSGALMELGLSKAQRDEKLKTNK